MLAEFMLGGLEAVHCAVCRSALAVAPTVLLIDDRELSASYVAGDLATSAPQGLADAWLRHFKELEPGRIPVFQRHPTVNALRQHMLEVLLTDVAQPVLLLYLADPARYNMLLDRRWGDISARLLNDSEVVLAVLHGAPQIAAVFTGTSRRGDPATLWDLAQTLPWLLDLHMRILAKLLDTYATGQAQKPLEAALRRHVDGVSGQLAAMLHETVAELARARMSGSPSILVYLMLCMEESLAGAVQLPAAFPVDWALAYFKFELQLRIDGDGDSPLQVLRIDPARAARSITRDAAWSALSELAPRFLDAHAITGGPTRRELILLDEVATAAGFPGLVQNVLYDHLHNADRQVRQDALFDFIARHAISGEVDALLDSAQLRNAADVLASAGDGEALCAAADEVVRCFGTSSDVRAAADGFLGVWLPRAKRSDLLIRRIGAEPRTWESDISALRRARLDLGRAAVLEDLARVADAIAVLKSALVILAADGTPAETLVAKVRLARLQALGGRGDESLLLLGDLMASGALDPDLLLELTIAFAELGRSDDAIQCIERAIALVTAPRRRAEFEFTRAHQLSCVNRRQEALEALLSLDRSQCPGSYAALFAEGSAWSNLLNARDTTVPESARERIGQTIDDLERVMATAESSGDMANYAGAVSIAGHLKRASPAYDGAAATTEELDRLARHGLPPHASTLVKAAAYAYSADNAVAARGYLEVVPPTLARRFGMIVDLSEITEAAGNLLLPLAAAARAATGDLADLGAVDWHDVRLIADLQRDSLGRARRIAAGGSPWLASRLSDQELMACAARVGHDFAVFDWFLLAHDGDETSGGATVAAVPYLTRVTSTKVATSPLSLDPEVVDRVQRRLLRRLMDWTRESPGDPFDLPAWQELRRQILSGLDGVLSGGEHVVIMQLNLGKPVCWHAAIGERYSCSYAASWSTILELLERPEPPRLSRAAAVEVSRFGDSDETAGAMARSTSRVTRMLDSAGITVAALSGVAAELAEVQDLLQRSELAVVQCHGYVEAGSRTVGLVLAADGQLPLRGPSTSPDVAKHVVSWQRMQSWSAAPRVLLLSACSTAHTYVARFDQPLSIYAALRHAGTQAVVAPQWDLPIEAIPIIEDVLARYLAGASLGEALRQACRHAERAGSKPWVAWALCLEGDWRSAHGGGRSGIGPIARVRRAASWVARLSNRS
ncbi:CHAT domain-containing protein [Catellatospora tritici]|uniref:CHAT domain-containing protein n=1 Tax=Catellatospora tritici TaxID=2851566 RepID=UPI001C2D123A|nr:CHAT domain-containing protein [Catellatospora tritici]MBV1855149.1 CHAT domain-containing protein [Catellatospora tritici]